MKNGFATLVGALLTFAPGQSAAIDEIDKRELDGQGFNVASEDSKSTVDQARPNASSNPGGTSGNDFCMSGVCLGQRLSDLSHVGWTSQETVPKEKLIKNKVVGFTTDRDVRFDFKITKRRAKLSPDRMIELLGPVHTVCLGYRLQMGLPEEIHVLFSAVPSAFGWQGYQVVRISRDYIVPAASRQSWIERIKEAFPESYDMNDRERVEAIGLKNVVTYYYDRKGKSDIATLFFVDTRGAFKFPGFQRRLRYVHSLRDHPQCSEKQDDTFRW